jgi:hypothetical protein
MTEMRRLPLALALVATTAFAAGPARRATAIGSAKEDEPCPAARDVGAQEVAFVRALTWAFEPAPAEVRAQAIEDLGLLGDVRALNALAQLVLDPNPALARAAVRAVGSLRHPRAEEILANVVRHPNVPEAVKLVAIDLVPYQNTFTALRFVHFVSRNRVQVPGTVQQAARALAAVVPEPTPEQALPVLAPAPAAPTFPLPLAGDSK